eukprot:7158005-Alexandrium_andersonii.AAC.1
MAEGPAAIPGSPPGQAARLGGRGPPLQKGLRGAVGQGCGPRARLRPHPHPCGCREGRPAPFLPADRAQPGRPRRDP